MKRLPAAFYALPSGREPVRDWLKALDRDDRKVVGEDIKDVEFSGSFEFRVGYAACGLIRVKSSFPAMRKSTVRMVANRV